MKGRSVWLRWSPALLALVVVAASLGVSSLSGQERAPALTAWIDGGDGGSIDWAESLLGQHRVRATRGQARLDITAGSALRFLASAGSFDALLDSRLELTSTIGLIAANGRPVDFSDLAIVVRDGIVSIRDKNNRTVFSAIDPRVHYDPLAGRLVIDGAGLAVSSWLAEELAAPLLAGVEIGRLSWTATTRRLSAEELPAVACSNPVWPGSPGTQTDVEMVSLGSYAPNWGCTGGCTGSSESAQTWWSPSATLENAGTTDVPWYDWLGNTNPQPPYGNRQHPFLTWGLYRVGANGVVDQIGRAGVKHGYYTTNTSCSCPGGNILWSASNSPNQVGCRDTYSAGNNNESRRLGPRVELIPDPVVWASCGSVWDPDCTGTTSDHGLSAPHHRMVVRESDLAATGGEGQLFLEAWYLIRDDDLPENNLRHVEVTTQWNGSSWQALSFVGGQTSGPFIDRWVTPGLAPMSANQSLASPDGGARLAVRVSALGEDQYRYDYALMNLDFALVETEGSEPDLRMLTHEGLRGLTVPLPDGITLSDLEFADGTGQIGPWTHQVDGNELTWRAPSGADSLTWGALVRFSLTADRAPAPVQALLLAGPPEASKTYPITILGPVGVQVFSDRFEAED